MKISKKEYSGGKFKSYGFTTKFSIEINMESVKDFRTDTCNQYYLIPEKSRENPFVF